MMKPTINWGQLMTENIANTRDVLDCIEFVAIADARGTHAMPTIEKASSWESTATLVAVYPQCVRLELDNCTDATRDVHARVTVKYSDMNNSCTDELREFLKVDIVVSTYDKDCIPNRMVGRMATTDMIKRSNTVFNNEYANDLIRGLRLAMSDLQSFLQEDD